MKPAQDDEELIAACLDGDESAWSSLIRRYRRLIYSIPVAYRMQSDEADEIFQRVALKLFNHLATLRNRSGLASWLIVTTRRECASARRASNRFNQLEEAVEEELQQEPDDVVQALHEVECEHALALAFERMEGICRQLLAALYLEQPSPSYKELAERLGRPVGSLGPTRSRCLAKLREIYLSIGGKSLEVSNPVERRLLVRRRRPPRCLANERDPMKNWEEWAGEALKGRRLHEPPPRVLRAATALGERSPARSSGWPGWMRGLAAASVVGLALLGGTLLLRQAPPSLPDRGVDSMIRGTRVQLQSPSGDLAEAPRSLSWQPFEEADHYRVRILAVDDAVLWEKQVSEASVALPDELRQSLRAAVAYRWSVEAFDADDRVTGRSELSRFRIKP